METAHYDADISHAQSPNTSGKVYVLSASLQKIIDITIFFGLNSKIWLKIVSQNRC